MAPKSYAAIEAGGTKFICALFDANKNVLAKTRIATTTFEETIGQVIDFYQDLKSQGHDFDQLGLASFGPLDLNPNSPTFGNVTKTPKPYWTDAPLGSRLSETLDVKVSIDTDVNAAALAEYRWGAGQGFDVVVYITVGTGFGGGLVVGGRTVKGLVHPEMGHMRIKVPEGVQGQCPFHGDCVEGLASGTSMQKIWNQSTQDMPQDHPAWETEANVLGQVCHNLLMTLSAQKIILGGGVMQQSFLLPKIIEQTEKNLGDYICFPQDLALSDIITAPGLSTDSGLLGALALLDVNKT
ncbi:ROK family protein [Glaciecola siphonariae]|uniref:fructokinase n=1 Tax=Glaciecola siphonariae TaxID=521012 RepID=A0ABV9LVM0_9ALTE